MKEHRNISIADQIFDQLERDILSGQYKRGEVLSELRLSKELDVSRTLIREALLRLEQENLLAETGRGLEVIGISSNDMLDMYDIRLHLEGEAARRAALNISDQQLSELLELTELQRYYINKQGNSSSEHTKNLDSQFHELLYRSCGSKAYTDVLIRIHKKMTKFRMASISKQREHSSPTTSIWRFTMLWLLMTLNRRRKPLSRMSEMRWTGWNTWSLSKTDVHLLTKNI